MTTGHLPSSVRASHSRCFKPPFRCIVTSGSVTKVPAWSLFHSGSSSTPTRLSALVSTHPLISRPYPELSKKLFPHGADHPLVGDFLYCVWQIIIVANVCNSVVQVGEVTEECLSSAWVLLESLEKSIAAATSSAAKAVNKNQIYKRYNFRPLRYHIYCVIPFQKYTHICFQRIAFNIYQNLGNVSAVFEGMRFANCACIIDFQNWRIRCRMPMRKRITMIYWNRR